MKKAGFIGLFCFVLIGLFLWQLSGSSVKSSNKSSVNQNAKNEHKVTLNESGKIIYNKFGKLVDWAKDPTVPDNLINKDSSVVKLKVISIGDAMFLPENKTFYTDRPFTPIEVEIFNTLSGIQLSGKVTIYVEGGDIKISELIKKISKGDADKEGLSALSEEDKNTKYASFTTDYDYKMEIGNEYVVILARQSNGAYTVMANGYGIFEKEPLDKSVNDEIHKNVITGKTHMFRIDKR